MLGWKIFVHSVKMVFRNRWEALRIALVPSTLIAIVTYLFFQSQTTRSANQPWTEWFGSLSSIAQIGFVLVIVANVFVIIWVFIAWHRLVLLEEFPKSWMPPLKKSAFVAYVKASIRVLGAAWVISFLIGVSFYFILFFLTKTTPLSKSAMKIVPVASFLLSYYFVFRLGLVFPAVAVGERLTVREAFRTTKGRSGTLLFLTFIQLVGLFCTSVLIELTRYVVPLAATSTEVFVQLFYSFVCISVWTTMYGIFIEKRELA